ncbi:unnamed protein product [Oppiella nova]|uniref:CUB domain-containing protein n=1 Tax=Oppiella nova TaxID=334625 RepID=A0A7R9QC97_9ACAR|nr:unnamed protein product [Oppiella nova]CAG2163014.1 unnamed protein product [Oppiella nova]
MSRIDITEQFQQFVGYYQCLFKQEDNSISPLYGRKSVLFIDFLLHSKRWQCLASLLNAMLAFIEETSHPYNPYNISSDLDRCNRTVEIYQTVSGPPVTDANRGKPMHCTYRIRIRPQRDDWVVFVRFTRLKVGEPSDDRQKCIGGYVQIVDGYRESNYSNKDHSGYYCGEIDTPKTYISETPYVKVVFHVEDYQMDSYIQFDANVEQQNSVNSRYGQFHQLYPHRRGVPIAGTYCEKTYPDCSPGPRCTIQSPGYPGIYGRNLRCRYHLNARHSLVGLELSAFDVDGQACDNLLMCFPRPVSTKLNDCPFDFVRIYDGVDESAPIIATLCGKGRIKSSIISSTSNMLVEFITSPAGPLLSTGFHFKADAIIDTATHVPIQLLNGSCVIERELTVDSNVGNSFAPIRSWYPSNTTCLYKFRAKDTKALISLEFISFRVERTTLCQESLRIFDANDADMSALITRLCDMNKPQSGNVRTSYMSSGPALTVQFSSLVGSFDGSSLNYVFEVKLIHRQSDSDVNDLSKMCSKHITPDSMTSGSVVWNYDDFNRSESTGIVCNASFDASSLQHGRVNVSMLMPFMATNCKQCISSPTIVIYRNIDRRHANPSEPLCYCAPTSSADTSYVVSIGAQMIISLQLPAEWRAQHLTHYFSPIHVCPPLHSTTAASLHEKQTKQNQNFYRRDIIIKSEDISLQHQSVSPNTYSSSVITIYYMSRAPANRSFLLFKYTQLKLLFPITSAEQLVPMGRNCEFLCTNPPACLKQELVCNGVANCPVIGSGGRVSEDEDEALCKRHKLWSVLMNESTLLLVMGAAGLLMLCCITFISIYICKRMKKKRHRF